MDTNEIAWLAGLFEGEGCVSFHGKNEVHLVINMTDQDVMERVHKLTGFVGSFRFYESKNPNHKDTWNWAVGERDQVIMLITLLLPWMGERRSRKMKAALERLKNNRGINKPIVHGTPQGYRTERYRKAGPCQECTVAMSKYNQGIIQRTEHIVKLASEKLTQSEIAAIVGCSPATVSRTLSKVKEK